MITVKELIEFLEKQPQDLLVIYGLYSEHCLMKLDEVSVQEHCEPRPDGWVQWERPDMPKQQYLVFPGN